VHIFLPSLPFNCQMLRVLHDFRFLPQCRWDLCSFWILRSVECYSLTDISGLLNPTIAGQAIWDQCWEHLDMQLICVPKCSWHTSQIVLPLKVGPHSFSWNVSSGVKSIRAQISNAESMILVCSKVPQVVPACILWAFHWKWTQHLKPLLAHVECNFVHFTQKLWLVVQLAHVLLS
jgi:hypothetical protein